MKYNTTDEWKNFRFEGAYIDEMQQMNGYFYAILDNVTILPDNSCNRDIREMRTNQLRFALPDGQLVSLVEEGYKVYDANGRLTRQQEDIVISPENYGETLKSLEGCMLYAIEKSEDIYTISVDTEDHTFRLDVRAVKDTEEWDRFLNMEQM